MCGWDNCPQRVSEQVLEIAHGASQTLGGNLVGVYLHGSLALGCFHPSRSDIDLLIAVDRPLASEDRRSLGRMSLGLSCAPCPIEFSVVRRTALVPWRHPAPFEFHYSESWRARVQQELEKLRWELWEDSPDDPDLAAHITVVQSRGIRVTGESMEEVFPVVPWADFVASIVADVQEALRNAASDPVYAVLNACRLLVCLQSGAVCSKHEGGTQALAYLPDQIRPVVMAAWETYANGGSDCQLSPEQLGAFLAWTRSRLPVNAG